MSYFSEGFLPSSWAFAGYGRRSMLAWFRYGRDSVRSRFRRPKTIAASGSRICRPRSKMPRPWRQQGRQSVSQERCHHKRPLGETPVPVPKLENLKHDPVFRRRRDHPGFQCRRFHFARKVAFRDALTVARRGDFCVGYFNLPGWRHVGRWHTALPPACRHAAVWTTNGSTTSRLLG